MMDSVCSSWSRLAWKASYEVYGKILKHPFIKELSAGTLPREKFMYYLGQDALYLKEFGQAMAAAASTGCPVSEGIRSGYGSGGVPVHRPAGQGDVHAFFS